MLIIQLPAFCKAHGNSKPMHDIHKAITKRKRTIKKNQHWGSYSTSSIYPQTWLTPQAQGGTLCWKSSPSPGHLLWLQGLSQVTCSPPPYPIEALGAAGLQQTPRPERGAGGQQRSPGPQIRPGAAASCLCGQILPKPGAGLRAELMQQPRAGRESGPLAPPGVPSLKARGTPQGNAPSPRLWWWGQWGGRTEINVWR